MHCLRFQLGIVVLIFQASLGGLASDSFEAIDCCVVIAQNDQSRSPVPALLGTTEAHARKHLKQYGFSKVSAYVTSGETRCPSGHDGFVPGRVCATNPPWGTTVSTGTEIALLVQGERTADGVLSATACFRKRYSA
jgi:hypothetical protein